MSYNQIQQLKTELATANSQLSSAQSNAWAWQENYNRSNKALEEMTKERDMLLTAAAASRVSAEESQKREVALRNDAYLRSQVFNSVDALIEVRNSRVNARFYLWGNAQKLSNASPYFRNIFSSEYQESQGICSDDEGEAEDEQEADSDDELDEIFAKEPHLSKRPKAAAIKNVIDNKMFHIRTSANCYATWNAVLHYICTGHIDFENIRQDPSIKVPKSISPDSAKACPKSVARLAHFLEIPALQTKAVANLISQLGAANAEYNLFAPVVQTHQFLRQAVLDWIVANYAKVTAHRVTQEQELAAKALIDGPVSDQALAEVTNLVT